MFEPDSDQSLLLNRRRLAEVTLFDIQFNGGGPLLRVSTHNITVGGNRYTARLKSWSGLGRTAVRATSKAVNPDIRLEFLNRRYKTYAHLSLLDADYAFAYAQVTISRVYLDDQGAQADPVTLFVGRMDGIDSENRETFTCGVSHISSRLDKLKIQEMVGLTAYPGADPDAIGKPEPEIFGAVDGSPCLPVDAGAVTRLAEDVGVGATTINLTEAQGEGAFPSSGSAMVEDDTLSWTGKTGKQLTGVTGVSEFHTKGAQIAVVQDHYDYLAMRGPMKAISGVLVDGVRQAAGYTAYTGQSGDAHPDIAGKAAVRFTVRPTLGKQVNLTVDEGSHEHEGNAWTGEGARNATYNYRWAPTAAPGWTADEHIGKAFKDADGHYFYIYDNTTTELYLASIHGQTVKSGTSTGSIIRTQIEPLYQDTFSSSFNGPPIGVPTALCDGNWNSYCSLAVDDAYIYTTRSAVVSDKGIIVGAKLAGTYGNSGSSTAAVARSLISGGAFTGQTIYGGGSSVQTVRTANTLTKGSLCLWSDFSGITLKAMNTASGYAAYWEHWVEVYYIPYGGGSSPATGVSLSGNSTAETVIGREITIEGEGYQDNGSGTYTGTADALIKTPADIIKYLLMARAGLTSVEVGASFDAVAALQETAGYEYGFALLDKLKTTRDESGDTFRALIDELAFFGRSVFYWGADGKAEITYIPAAAPAAVMTIKESETRDGFTFGRTPETDVFNDFQAVYDYIYTGDKTGDWAGEVPDSDTNSQTRYDGIYHKRYELWPIRSTAVATDFMGFRKQQEKGQLIPMDFDIWWKDGARLQPGDTYDIVSQLHNGKKFWTESVEDVGDGFYKVTGVSWPT